jgi:hypothetical protein
MDKISLKCSGIKNFKRCTRIVLVEKNTREEDVLCWEHQDQMLHKMAEKRPAKIFHVHVEKKKKERLTELAQDEENVHTPEVNNVLIKSIQNLKKWALEKKIKLEINLSETIETFLLSNFGRAFRSNENARGAILHLRECYHLQDDMVLLGVTYPQLSSWVWHRIMMTQDDEKKSLLLQRFFEEVFESTKLCLNGNMARLVNVFACIDDEINPQDGSKVYTPEILQTSIYNIIHKNLELDQMIHEIRTILFEASVPLDHWGDWIDAAIDEKLNL